MGGEKRGADRREEKGVWVGRRGKGCGWKGGKGAWVGGRGKGCGWVGGEKKRTASVTETDLVVVTRGIPRSPPPPSLQCGTHRGWWSVASCEQVEHPVPHQSCSYCRGQRGCPITSVSVGGREGK